MLDRLNFISLILYNTFPYTAIYTIWNRDCEEEEMGSVCVFARMHVCVSERVVCVRLRERDRANLQKGPSKGKEKAIPGDTWFCHPSQSERQTETSEASASVTQSQPLPFLHHQSHLFLSTIHSRHAFCTPSDDTRLSPSICLFIPVLLCSGNDDSN